jgi:predicted permease
MWRTVRMWLRSRPNGHDIDREIRDHLRLEAEERQRDGEPERQARDAAHRAFGNVTLAREDTRAIWVWTWAERLAQDLRYAARLMRRSPVFTIVTVATLALGIGANTAIFTLVDAVLLKALPVTAPERLAIITRIGDREQRYNISYPLFERLREETSAFAGVLAMEDGIAQVEMRGPEPGSRLEHAVRHLVSGEYFSVLGTSALIGRTFTPDDNRTPDAHPVAVLSHAFWMRRFGGDMGIIGARITLGKTPLTVIGVARPGFFGEVVGRHPDIWAPLMMQPQFAGGRSMLADPRVGWLRVMGRLRDGVTHAGAEAALMLALERLSAAGDEAVGQTRRLVTRVDVSDGSQGLVDFREEYSRPLRVLTGVVTIVLLVACTNVSGLLLARARARQREVTVRLAIGAGRWRIIRQFLTESLVLAAIGGALGVALAWQGSRLLLWLISTNQIPVAIDVTPDARTLAFTTLAALTTVLIFGLAPALAAARMEVGPTLERATPRTRTTLSRLLVVAQVALSLLLVTGGTLFLLTLRNLRTQDLGFESEALLQVFFDARASGYTNEQQPALSRRLLEGVRGVPGLVAVTAAHTAFGSGGSHTCCIAIPGRAFAADENREIQTLGVGSGYFRTMRLPVVLGRDFEEREISLEFGTPPRIAIVSEAFARKYFPGRSPVGERFGWGDAPKVSYDITIVGVARDANYGRLRGQPRPLIYFPQFGGRLLMVRAGAAPEAMAASLRRAIAAVDPNLVLLEMRYVSEDIERALVREKLLARLSTAFGLAGALLTALGLYGLMAYAVVARTREIGIRVALGAPRARVLLDEMRGALGLVAVGIVAGSLLTPAAGSLVASQLFGVSAGDPRIVGLAAAFLLTVSAAAAYVPARRAARVDPTIALRAE